MFFQCALAISFVQETDGETPLCNYTINEHNYTKGYYLANGIYPQRAAFLKTIYDPQDNKQNPNIGEEIQGYKQSCIKEIKETQILSWI